MSKRWKNHNEWVAEQFQNKYLKKSYRNVLIHTSIIEGMLIKKSGEKSFIAANKFLLDSGVIDSSEHKTFDEIRKIRNKISHNIFSGNSGAGLSQKDIDILLKEVIYKMHTAYKTSRFLNRNLFMEYSITRPSSIIYNLIH